LMEAYNADEVAAGDAFFGQAVWAVEQDSMKVYQTMDFNPASSLESTIVTNYAQKFFMGELQLDDTLKGMDADLTSQIGNPYGY